MTLIEGQSDAGKSVLCQQMIWGSLTGGFKVLLFTTENTVKSLVSQMESLGLGILDYLLLGRLKIFYMKPSRSKCILRQLLIRFWRPSKNIMPTS